MKRLAWAVVFITGAMAVWWFNRDQPAETASSAPALPVTAKTLVPTSTSVSDPKPSAAPAPAPRPRRSSAPPPKPDSYPDWLKEVVASLSLQMQNADALLTAAMILNVYESAQGSELRNIEQLLADAHLQAPLDPLIAATALRICLARTNCDPLIYETTLRNVDGGNELGQIARALNVAKSGDRNQLIAALEDLRRYRLRLYSGELGVRAWRAISIAATSALNAPPPSELHDLQNALALRVVSSIPPPAYDLFIEKCQTNDWNLERACLSLADDLARTELIDLQLIAFSIRRSALSENYRGVRTAMDPADEQHLMWLRSNLVRLPPTPEQWLGLMQNFESEFVASRRWLEQNQVKVPRAPRTLEWR